MFLRAPLILPTLCFVKISNDWMPGKRKKAEGQQSAECQCQTAKGDLAEGSVRSVHHPFPMGEWSCFLA